MKGTLILFALVGLLAACRSPRAVGRAVGKKDSTQKKTTMADAPQTDSATYIRSVLGAVRSGHINFTTFSAKLGVDYKGSDGKGHDLNANIKMYKDSAIWLSVNAILGIEALRVLVTKDSVKMLNKLEKTYAARGISFLQEATSLPLDLHTLQELIIGNPVYLDSNIVRYNRSGNTIALVSLGRLFKNIASFSSADTSIVHSKLTDTDPFRNRTADLIYTEYETKTGVRFSTNRQINVSERGHLDIKLDFKNYTFNDKVSFPFSVPKNYPRL